jgi:RHS repeat-associated protein
MRNKTYSNHANSYRASKSYELVNHLGNVLVVITDKKLSVCTGNEVTSYSAEVVSATDYSPFGAPLAGRSFTAANVKYAMGFNGKMKDDEAYGDGNCYDYGFRIYNPRLGRFLSVDPLTKSFPWYTPYQFSGNTPIMAVDLDGLEPKVVITGNQVTKPIIGFLQGALGIKKQVSEQTRWHFGAKSSPGAITIGQHVMYSLDWRNNTNVNQWVSLVGHEHSHRADYESQGFAGFLSQYFSEYSNNQNKGMSDYDAYKNISTEQKAYSTEARIDAFFANKDNAAEFNAILNNKDLSDEVKSDKLEILGAEKIAIPALEQSLNMAQNLFKGSEGALKETAGKMVQSLTSALANKKAEVAALKEKVAKSGN